METNDHILEMRYINIISELKKSKEKPNWTDFIWKKKYKKLLNKRYDRLKESMDKGFISIKAFNIWSKMIKEAL